VLQQLARSRQLAFADTDRLTHCIRVFSEGKADFADYLIGRLARERGCRVIYTFDKLLLAEKGFEAP